MGLQISSPLMQSGCAVGDVSTFIFKYLLYAALVTLKVSKIHKCFESVVQ